MSTTDPAPTGEHRAGRTTIAVAVGAVVLVLVLGAALALDRWGPGNMGRGFAVGALVGGGLGGLALWRGWRRPDRATTGDRLFTGTADERDQAIATRAFAALGVAALPLAMIATVAVALGSPADATLFFLLVALVAVGLGAFARTARRS